MTELLIRDVDSPGNPGVLDMAIAGFFFKAGAMRARV